MTIQLIEPQAPPDLVTRGELAELARAEGMDVTERTIRYWASEGLLPRPYRVAGEGTRSFYPMSLLDRLRVLCATRPSRIKKLRRSIGKAETIHFGDDTFSVLPASAVWERDSTEFSLRMLEDGSGMLLIQRKKAQ